MKMFKVIRTRYVSKFSPAGEIFTFSEKTEENNAKDVATFLAGKDVQNYVIIKEGFDIDLRGLDYLEMIKTLIKFEGF